jgi:hypothetical protein
VHMIICTTWQSHLIPCSDGRTMLPPKFVSFGWSHGGKSIKPDTSKHLMCLMHLQSLVGCLCCIGPLYILIFCLLRPSVSICLAAGIACLVNCKFNF